MLSSMELETVITLAQHALDDATDFPAHHFRLVALDPMIHKAQSIEEVAEVGRRTDAQNQADQDKIALTVRLDPSFVEPESYASLRPLESLLQVYFANDQVPQRGATSSPLATFLAKELQSLFAEEQASLSYLLDSAPSLAQVSGKAVLPADTKDRLARRSTRSFKYADTYHLTFSMFSAGGRPSAWDFEAALEAYIKPLLDSMASISKFTVDSQVQLYASFSPSIRQPEFDQERQAWTLRKEDLGGFINAAEWPLSPSIGAGPTVNFILYIPEPGQSPLVIADNGGTSWLVPQWGGMQILNNANQSAALTRADLEPAMHVFSNQLLSLLGVPDTPASLPLRLSTLSRIHTTALLSSASSTLGALARLTQSLESIAIPDSVADSVATSLSRLDATCKSMHEGRWHAALENARVAEAEAEKAFFERSMVGQVYFPEEHKVAVYLPLLGPVAVPLIMAGVKELRAFLQSRRAGQKG